MLVVADIRRPGHPPFLRHFLCDDYCQALTIPTGLAEPSFDGEGCRRGFREFKLSLAVVIGYKAQIWSLGRAALIEVGNVNQLVAQRTTVDNVDDVNSYDLAKARGTDRQ